MVPPRYATLAGKVPKDVVDAIDMLHTYSASLEQDIQGIKTAPAAVLTKTQLVQVQQALQAQGTTPLNVTNLLGTNASMQFGTHQQRVSTSPPGPNTGFYETDRFALYVNVNNGWQLAGNFIMDGGLLSGRPGDLSAADDGYRYWALDQNEVIYRFTGNLWRYSSGLLVDLFANSPAWNVTDVGFVFFATDTKHTYLSDYGTGAWLDITPSGGAGKILQVVEGSATGSVTENAAALTSTGLSATITPASTLNNVLVFVHQCGCGKGAVASTAGVHLELQRAGGQIAILSTSDGRNDSAALNLFGTIASSYLDSPATVAATTYETKFNTGSAGTPAYVQVYGNERSSIILMEVAP